MADPFRPLAEVTQRASIHYAAPFLVVCLLTASLAFFGLAVVAIGFLQTALILLGITCVLAAIALTAYLFIRRPELLRSERFEAFAQFMSWIGTPTVDEARVFAARDALRVLLTEVDPKPKPTTTSEGKS